MSSKGGRRLIAVEPNVQSDGQLMERIAQGDCAAFENLTGRHGNAIRLMLEGILRDPATVEDVFQETLLRLWSRAAQWDGRGSPRGWLHRVATNLALNHLRTVSRRREDPLPGHAGEQGPEHDDGSPDWLVDRSSPGPGARAELAEQWERLSQLTEGLSPDKRAVFRMVRQQEMDIAATAEALGIPEGTVRSRLHYATAQIRRKWHESETL